MADLTISIDIDGTGVKRDAEQIEREIKGIGDTAEKSNKQVRETSSLAAQDVGQMHEAAGRAGNALKMLGTIGVAALAAIAAAAVAAAKWVFDVSKQFAEAGVSIHKMQEQTGFAAETLSALEMQFRRTGTSGDDFREGMKTLVKTIGDAANGSVEATAKLARLGIDPQKAIKDLDGTFRTVLKSIVEIQNPVERANRAMDVFGENGYKLLPFLSSFNGDIDALIRKARELGVTMSEDDVRAAVEFEKSLADVQEMVRGVWMTFAKEYMPIVKSVLDNTKVWLTENKATVNAWANETGLLLLGLIGYWNDLTNAVGRFKATKPPENDLQAFLQRHPIAGVLMPHWALAYDMLIGRGRQQAQNQPPTSVTTTTTNTALTGNLAKLLGTTKAATAAKPELSEAEKQAIELQRILDRLKAEYAFFGQKTQEARLQQELFGKSIFATNQHLVDEAAKIAQSIDKKTADAEASKKAKDAQEKFADALVAVRERLKQSATDATNDTVQQVTALEMQLKHGRELNDVELLQIAHARELTEFAAEMLALQKEHKGVLLDGLNKEIAAQREILLSKQNQAVLDAEKIQRLREQIALQQGVKSMETDLRGQLEQLRNGNRELSTYEQTLRKIEADLKNISPEQKEHLLNLAKQIDAQKAYNEQYEQTYQFIRGTFDVLTDSSKSWGDKLKTIFGNILDRFKKMVLDMAAAWLSSKLMGMMGLGGGQGQGGGVGGFLQQILGLGGGTGTGPGGTPNWNPNIAGGGTLPGGITAPGGGSWGPILGEPSGRAGGVGANIAGGGFFGSLKDLFKPTRNPITGKMNSGFAGVLGGIGAIASVVGGFLPGRAGNIVSMAGMGLSIGAMFGPIGAGIGAAIGAVAGLFMGDPKKKRDKKEKMPVLEKGFADALAELRRMLSDKNALLQNPDGIVAQAMEIRNQIKNGFGIQMESKKYQKIMKERISVKLTEADALIKQIKDLAEVYRAANDRERRLIPEFASGGFPRVGQMSLVGERGRELFVPNVAGRVISNRETEQILSNAGGSVNVTVVVQQDEQGRWNAMAQTDAGKRIVAKVVTDGFRNDEIKTARRAG